MLNLAPDFKELLKLFLTHEVKYLIVGGYAVAFHGYPRFTGDLDIWVDRSKENAEKIVLALKEFGFNLPSLKRELFTGEDVITRMGVEPMKVEIFTHIPGLIFSPSFVNKVRHRIDNSFDIYFLSLEDLKTSKKTTSRTQDLLDLEKLP